MTTYTRERTDWQNIVAALDDMLRHDFATGKEGRKFAGKLAWIRARIVAALDCSGDKIDVEMPARAWTALETLLRSLGGDAGTKLASWMYTHRIEAERDWSKVDA